MSRFSKWVACWGNATSISDRKEAIYSKDLTLRYPIKMCFDGSCLRFRFSNLTGTEPVTLTKVSISLESEWKPCGLLFNGKSNVTIEPGKEVTSDEISFDIKRGDNLFVSIYLGDYTQMNAGTVITGPLSKGFYSYGDQTECEVLPLDLTRKTSWFFFMNTIDILTEEKNHALVCYGDSITAQSWPDYLTLAFEKQGKTDISVIRRAVSGTRILRQYDCITYQAYGLKGETRFPIEIETAGASDVIIQHGINDIIHPVGVENNPFRPWSDMPTAKDLADGVQNYYLPLARQKGLKVWSGTLLPIWNWRTYSEDREAVRSEYNEWLRTSPLFDGCIDFDAALRDESEPRSFAVGFDSGDHLHPSEAAYEAMAEYAAKYFL